jgi:cell pole-organizing protein PopZ
MSAINSNSDDRDLDAIRRAQRAHEPSMEEILASIRNIIADEREPAQSAAPKSAPQRAAASAAGPQIVYSKDAATPRRVASEPSQRAESAPANDAASPKVVWRQSQLADSESAADAAPPDEEPLLSPEANEAVISSFGALSVNLAMRSGELADGLVREMLRPMLKQWLDENLPVIVERLVRAEIQRVARGQK